LVFDEPVLAVESLAALWAQAEAAPSNAANVAAAPAFPAEDTPMKVPPEVERLRGHAERPVRS